jgi:hypothetical protein
MCTRREEFESLLYFFGKPAEAYEPLLVSGELPRVGEAAVDEQVRDFFELTVRGEVDDVEAAIVEVVAAAADGAERGFAGGSAGKGYGLLGFETCRGGGFGFAHSDPPESIKVKVECWECLL